MVNLKYLDYMRTFNIIFYICHFQFLPDDDAKRKQLQKDLIAKMLEARKIVADVHKMAVEYVSENCYFALHLSTAVCATNLSQGIRTDLGKGPRILHISQVFA